MGGLLIVHNNDNRKTFNLVTIIVTMTAIM